MQLPACGRLQFAGGAGSVRGLLCGLGALVEDADGRTGPLRGRGSGDWLGSWAPWRCTSHDTGTLTTAHISRSAKARRSAGRRPRTRGRLPRDDPLGVEDPRNGSWQSLRSATALDAAGPRGQEHVVHDERCPAAALYITELLRALEVPTAHLDDAEGGVRSGRREPAATRHGLNRRTLYRTVQFTAASGWVTSCMSMGPPPAECCVRWAADRRCA